MKRERLIKRWWRENTHDLQAFFFVENNNEEREIDYEMVERIHMICKLSSL
jgi:hypothetical protein